MSAVYVLVGLVGYLLGSVNFAIIICKRMAGFDIREKAHSYFDKINLEEFNGHDYEDIDLLYEKETIDKNTIAIRKNLEKSIIRISFKNPYNYEVSIIVKEQNNKITFDTIYK